MFNNILQASNLFITAELTHSRMQKVWTIFKNINFGEKIISIWQKKQLPVMIAQQAGLSLTVANLQDRLFFVMRPI